MAEDYLEKLKKEYGDIFGGATPVASSEYTTESYRPGSEKFKREAAAAVVREDPSGIAVLPSPLDSDYTRLRREFMKGEPSVIEKEMPMMATPDPDFPLVEDLGDRMYGPISFNRKDPLSTIEDSAFPSWLGSEADAVERFFDREVRGKTSSLYDRTMPGSSDSGALSLGMESGYGDILDHFILSEAPVGGFLWSAKEAITDDSRESYYDDHRDRAISEWKHEHPEGTIEEFSEAVRREPWRYPLRGDPEEGETIESPYFVEGEIGELPVKTDEGSVIPHERERLYGLGPDGISSVTPAPIPPTSAPVPEVLSPEEKAAARRAETVEVDPLAGYDAYADALEADKFLGRDYWAGYDSYFDPGKKYLYSEGVGGYGHGKLGEPLGSGAYIPLYRAEDYYKLPKETLEGIYASAPFRGTPWGIASMSDPERVDYAGLLAATGYEDLHYEPHLRASGGISAPAPRSDYYKDLLADMDFKTSPHFGGPALSPEVLAEIAASVMPGTETTAGPIYT